MNLLYFSPEPKETYETLIEPTYCALPHHISVRSTKPPKIVVHSKRPEQTRKGRTFVVTRRQPDVELVPRCNDRWQLGFHGQELKYADYLKKRHGPSISKYKTTASFILKSAWQ